LILPVKCKKCGKRIWIEFNVMADEYVYTGSEEELKKYVIREINIIRVWEDEKLAEEVRDQFRRLIKSGDSIERAVKIISEVYGIPVLALEEFLSDLIEEVKIHAGR